MINLTFEEIEKYSKEYFEEKLKIDNEYFMLCGDSWICDAEEWFYNQFDEYIDTKIVKDFKDKCRVIWQRMYQTDIAIEKFPLKKGKYYINERGLSIIKVYDVHQIDNSMFEVICDFCRAFGSIVIKSKSVEQFWFLVDEKCYVDYFKEISEEDYHKTLNEILKLEEDKKNISDEINLLKIKMNEISQQQQNIIINKCNV